MKNNKKFVIKLIIFLLIIVNFIVLALLWLGWQMDYKCGDGFEILMSFGDGIHYGPEALHRLYSGINNDIYYFAGFTFILSVCLIVLDIINSNEVPERKTHQWMKEVPTKAMEDEVLRDDD